MEKVSKRLVDNDQGYGFPQTNFEQRMWSSSEPGKNTEHERLHELWGESCKRSQTQHKKPERVQASSRVLAH